MGIEDISFGQQLFSEHIYDLLICDDHLFDFFLIAIGVVVKSDSLSVLISEHFIQLIFSFLV